MSWFFEGIGLGLLIGVVVFFWWEGRRMRLDRRYTAQDATIIRMRAKERL